MSDRWDVKLTPVGSGVRQSLRVHIPTPLCQPMIERGFDRAIVSVTPEGILIQPFVGGGGHQSLQVVELPQEWPGMIAEIVLAAFLLIAIFVSCYYVLGWLA